VPEIWIAVAEKTGIPQLRLTTRDIPDYDVLMKGRLKILAEHNLGIGDIQNVIATLQPLEGAKQFLDQLRSITQVLILSDTFEEFAQPLMRQLAWPTLLCHRLVIQNGKVRISAIPAKHQAARNLPMTASERRIGNVRNSRNAPGCLTIPRTVRVGQWRPRPRLHHSQ